MRKIYRVRVNASSRYPIFETFVIEATGFAKAVYLGIKKWKAIHRNVREYQCQASAQIIKGVAK